jgi:hypothetical protein
MTRRADSKIGRLRAALLELLAEHDADEALPTSGRFLFYEFVQRGVVDKGQTRGHPGVRRGVDQDVSKALTHLREDGEVPWEWVRDETRTLEDYRGATTVTTGVLAALDFVRLDPWDGDPPLVITESRSLAGVLRETVYQYTVPITSTNGQVGGFLHTNVAPVMQPGQRVIYPGDLDLAGEDIEANTRRVLESYTGPLAWERLAVTGEQVAEHSLPVIIKRDKRKGSYPAVETEALSQSILTGLLTARLDALLPDPLADVLERERAQRAELRVRLGGSA